MNSMPLWLIPVLEIAPLTVVGLKTVSECPVQFCECVCAVVTLLLVPVLHNEVSTDRWNPGKWDGLVGLSLRWFSLLLNTEICFACRPYRTLNCVFGVTNLFLLDRLC